MSIIRRLTQNINHLSLLLQEEQARLALHPNDYALSLSVNNLIDQVKSLEGQLYLENTRRSKEVISLRLIGDTAQFGSIPLLVVGGLMDAFSNALFETSKFIQFGKRGGKKVNKIVKDALDLRLDGIGSGSTVFYISAKTQPDLFGHSLSQQTFDNFIDFVSSEDAEIMIDRISEVGTTSIKYFSNFFKKLNDSDLEIEIFVDSVFRDHKIWRGDKDQIVGIYTVLNNLNIDDPKEVLFEGEIIALSKRGKIELLTNSGFRYVVDYSEDMLDIIRSLHISQVCKGKLLQTSIANAATGKTKFEYDLVEISPV